jgi:hypothetical protein
MVKNKAAVALGRRGGKKGGPARAAKLTAAERSESARKAVQARWAKVREERAAVESPGAEFSDAALLALLSRIKASNDPDEIRKLAAQVEQVVFHKQLKDA